MFPLRLLLHRFVRRGHLSVIDHTGRRHEFGTPAPVRLLPSASTIRPSTAASRSIRPCTWGGPTWTARLTIAEGQLSDFLNLLLINEQLASNTGSGESEKTARGVGPPCCGRQSPGARAPQRAPSLRSCGELLSLLPGRGPAVLVRLFRQRGAFARGGAGSQEAAHCSQARSAARTPRARHRLRLRRHGSVPRPQLRRARHRHNAQHRAAQDRPGAGRQARPDAPGRFQVRGLSPDTRDHSTASSRSACSSMWGGRTTGSSSRASDNCWPTTALR